jgi:hypothetical protein
MSRHCGYGSIEVETLWWGIGVRAVTFLPRRAGFGRTGGTGVHAFGLHSAWKFAATEEVP